MICRSIICAALIASPASAQSLKTWGYSYEGIPDASYIELHDPKAPNAVATLTFKNDIVHSQDETFSLHWQGIGVSVEFDWQYQDTHDERLIVTPPDGYIAVPSEIVVPEGATDIVHIYKWQGM